MLVCYLMHRGSPAGDCIVHAEAVNLKPQPANLQRVGTPACGRQCPGGAAAVFRTCFKCETLPLRMRLLAATYSTWDVSLRAAMSRRRCRVSSACGWPCCCRRRPAHGWKVLFMYRDSAVRSDLTAYTRVDAQSAPADWTTVRWTWCCHNSSVNCGFSEDSQPAKLTSYGSGKSHLHITLAARHVNRRHCTMITTHCLCSGLTNTPHWLQGARRWPIQWRHLQRPPAGAAA